MINREEVLKEDMQGKICIVTGANSGMGRETALALAIMGAQVIMLCRSKERGEKAREDMLKEAPHANLDLMLCDLASFSEIRTFVKEFKSKYDKLHVLINNAGIYHSKYQESEDEIPMLLAVNHFAPFLLASLLESMLKQSAPSRIINVNSGLHKSVKIASEEIKMIEKLKTTGMKGYSKSKLANMLTVFRRAELLKGSNVSINAESPGMVKTNLTRHSFIANVFWKLISPFIKSAEEGALPIIYLATSHELEGVNGKYFDEFEMSKPNPLCFDKKLQEEMWKKSEIITELTD
ncbi:MAG: Rhamnolipids biosynthesis 3-oxoacyl-[acyl-carrier-protein] reductase [Promethearchaeota archaeon]|nr:MAG: Rhamnolipids biosynthesis 3-oxoacyl-[acyl-carrier-protein] reductase [Candidatus Lokiarchaeota archaeon]